MTESLVPLRLQRLLFAQVFHDVMSPLSSLITGFDFVKEGDQKIVDLLAQSVKKLGSSVVFFRAALGAGTQIPLLDGVRWLGDYLSANTQISLSVSCASLKNAENTFPVQLLLMVCFWVSRQTPFRRGELSFDLRRLLFSVTLKSDRILSSSPEDAALAGEPASSVHESYAAYIFQLACESGVTLRLERKSDSLTVTAIFSA